MNRNGMGRVGMGMNANWKFTSKIASSVFAALAVVLLLAAGARPAVGQQGLPCPGQNWTASTPNVWAAEGSVKVMLNNQGTTNQPSIPTYLDDGYFNPWGYQQHPQPMTELNPVWSCPSGTPVISLAGAGRETVSFQVFITAAPGSVNPSALTGVTVGVTPLAGPGTTLTSDNTQTSNVLRYLEGYVPYTAAGATAPAGLDISGDVPDPLIPFYDPYDTGTPAIGTPFNVQPGTTQAVWVDVTIPAGQTAGTYTGTVTVSGNGVSASIPVNLTVWNGTLPRFDSGSVNPARADMLKSLMPLWPGRFDQGEGLPCGGPGCSQDQALMWKYQIMAHNYDFDTYTDNYGPALNQSLGGAYPWTSGVCCTATSFTSGPPTGPGATGTTSTLVWTAWDAYYGPAFTLGGPSAGGLFADGTAMRVFDSPAGTGGNNPWSYGTNNAGGNMDGGYTWTWPDYSCPSCATTPPAGDMQIYTNFAEQISMHFTQNQLPVSSGGKGWGHPELISYTWDEVYDKVYDSNVIFQDVALEDQALNNANTALSATWDPSTNPIRNFLTSQVSCQTNNDDTNFNNPECTDYENLSYPSSSFPAAWVIDWSPNPGVYMPGAPIGGSQPLDLTYECGATALTAGTGYEYTLDMVQGVPAKSTAPAPLSKWFYQAAEPFDSREDVGDSGVGVRANFWIAYKYGLDETTPSVGVPTPTYAMPGGVWDWAAEFWAGTPYTQSDGVNGAGGDGFFYPGNQLGTYNASGTLGASILSQSLVANGSGGIGGPVASIRMAQWRRGYEDYEYLYMLGHQGCPTSGVPAQCNRAAAEAVVDSMGGGGMTSGGSGTASWNALVWQNTDPGFLSGVWPMNSPGFGTYGAYTTVCTDTTAGAGGLANGLPNGPTGALFSYTSAGSSNCPGEWTNNPDRYAAARVTLATDLGWATVTTAPTITGLSPSTGSTISATTVIITGTNFTGATAVLFGGNPASSFTVNSATQITAVTGSGNGTVAVQVETPNGISGATSADLFSYVSPVTVTGVSPAAGVAVGGNTVTISGTDFNSGGATVHFGANLATNVVVVSASSITATAPAGSGTVDITVTTADGTSAITSADQYTYEVAPTVSGVTPNTGTSAGGTGVTVSGTGFASGSTTVTFGGVAATGVSVTSSTTLTATSPAYSTQSGAQVDVEVTTAYGTSAANSSDRFTYTTPVTITGLSVSGGPASGGTSVVITGTDFTGATAVMFGSNAAASYVVNSATQITAVSPAGGGVVNVTVAASGYVSPTGNADLFSYASVVAGGSFASFPTTAVGATSSTQMVSITLTAASNISSITVPPAQNGKQEFTVGTGGTCVVGGSNAAGTCTVAVTFSPQYPGVRMGALQVNNGGGVVGTAGLAGIGGGPEVAQSPGSLTLYAGGGPTGVTATPEKAINAAFSVGGGDALAVGGAGNVYIADNNNCLAYKVNVATNQIVVIAGNYTYASGAVTPSTTPEPALGANTCPRGIAVDSAGNVYIVDANTTNSGGNNDTVEEVFAATGQIQVIAGGGSTVPSTTSGPVPALSASFNDVNSLATDEAGDLYISDYCNNLVDKLSPAGQVTLVAGGGSTAPSTTAEAATSAQLHGPTGVVADDAGNLYISDQCDNNVDQVNLATGNIVVVAGGGSNAPTTTPVLATSAKLNAPAELAVDGAGDLYIADDCNNLVEEVTGLTTTSPQLAIVAGGGGTAPSTTPQSAPDAHFGNVQGLAMDGVGNLYVADSGNNVVSKVNTQAMALSFGNVAANTTSAPQSIALSNIGNAALSLASLSAATDFPLQTTGTCTVVSSPPQSLAAGGSCSLVYAFQSPSANGTYTESATLTDNTLNVTGSTQPISFTGTTTGGTSTPPAATPTFSPAAGTYTSAQTVTISDTTSGATIYYTTNGTTPTTSSTLYSGAITVSATETVKAIATATGYSTSATGSAVYTITPPAATPTFSPAAGTYTSAQTVTISDATSGAKIYYTTNGTTPTTSSTLYSGAITVSATETVEAIATATGYTTSATGSAAYTISGGAPTVTALSPSTGGWPTGGTSVTITGTNFTGATAVDFGGSAATSFTINSATQITAVAPSEPNNACGAVNVTVTTSGGTSAISSADQFSYGCAPALTSVSPSTGSTTSSTTVVITGVNFNPAGGDTVWTDPGISGITWTVNSTTQITAVIPASSSGTVGLYVSSGAGQSNGLNFTFSTATPAATPTFSPAAGTYTSAQTVTISDATSGAKIYYTTNGTTPTTSSTLYSGPITVSATETVEAIATASGYTTSATGSAAYTINTATPAATPTFSPAAGTYTSAQTVTISDATSGAKIYYTTNGTTPTTSSTLYSGPITVSATETVEAIATATGYSTSATGSAAYTINIPTPVATPTTTALTASPTSATAGGSVTLTATVSSSAGTPSGTVNFYNGSTLLGSGIMNSSGVAIFTTTNLPVGTDSLTASYVANSSYAASTSTVASVTVSAGTSPDYTLTANPTSMSIAPGQAGTSTLTVTPMGGYSGTLTLTCAALPINSDCTFTQSGVTNNSVTLSGNNQPVNITLTIQTNVARMRTMPRPFGPQSPSSPLSPILPALAFWWPGSMAGLAAFGRKRNLSKTQQRMLQLCLLVLMTGALAAGISGCGGGSLSTATTSTSITPAGTSNVTVTATPALGTGGSSHSATIALTIS